MTAWLIRHRERLAGIVAGSSVLAPAVALAARSTSELSTAPTGVPDRFDTFEKTIESVFNIVIIVAGIVFVVLFLIGGVQYLGSAGNEETTKKARQLMLDAVIGLVIVVTAWAVGTYVLSLLGLNEGNESGIPTRVE